MAALLGLPLLAYSGICFYAAGVLTMPPRNLDAAQTPARFGLAYEEVRFPSRAPGIELAGWLIPYPGAQRAVILLHGHTSSRSTEFAGRFPELGAALYARGFTVLMFDQRGHGASGGQHTGLGSLEHDDIAGALDWLSTQGFAPERIGVLGVSVGGAAAVRAAADNPAIAALVLDSTPASMLPVVQGQWAAASGLPDFFLPTTLIFARLRFGTDLEAAPPIAQIGRLASRPTLLIHGEADELVPVSDAMALTAALAGAELWLVPNGGHDLNYNADPQGYSRRVGDFFDAHVP
jgi:uncharacterized protein